MSGTAVRNVEARELDEDEFPEEEELLDAVREFTGAEAVMMEQDGAEITFPGGNVDAQDGQVLFQIGRGRSQFTAKMIDHTFNADMVYLYRFDGEGRSVRQPVPRAMVAQLLSEPHADGTGQAWFKRPQAPIAVPDVPCPSTRKPCPYMGFTKLQADQHFQHRHTSEFNDRERERKIANDERQILLQEKQLAILERLATGQAVAQDEARAALGVLAPEPAEMPGETSTVAETRRWLKENGFPFPKQGNITPREGWLGHCRAMADRSPEQPEP